MRGLSSLARDNPARPDVVAMTWPIRGVLSALRRGIAVGGVLVCVSLAVGHWWWPPAGTFARLVSAVVALVLVGFAVRVLIPAGRLPWRCLELLPRLMRRASLMSLGVAGVAVAALVAHAATGGWYLAVVALAGAPVMWALGVVEMLGAGLDDPGIRHAIGDLAGEFRSWWQTTRQELREAWSSRS
jgi:hypothetical protein